MQTPQPYFIYKKKNILFHCYNNRILTNGNKKEKSQVHISAILVVNMYVFLRSNFFPVKLYSTYYMKLF